MTIPANRDHDPERLRLRATRTVGACAVEQRLARECPSSAAAHKQGGRSSIRAWRATDTKVSKAPQSADRLSAMPDAKPASRHPAAAAATWPRPNGPDRTARMRAIEQAWKAERARQAEFEAAHAETDVQQALRHAEEVEARRRADERIRLALEHAKRFPAAASVEARGSRPRSSSPPRATLGSASRRPPAASRNCARAPRAAGRARRTGTRPVSGGSAAATALAEEPPYRTGSRTRGSPIEHDRSSSSSP